MDSTDSILLFRNYFMQVGKCKTNGFNFSIIKTELSMKIF